MHFLFTNRYGIDRADKLFFVPNASPYKLFSKNRYDIVA